MGLGEKPSPQRARSCLESVCRSFLDFLRGLLTDAGCIHLVLCALMMLQLAVTDLFLVRYLGEWVLVSLCVEVPLVAHVLLHFRQDTAHLTAPQQWLAYQYLYSAKIVILFCYVMPQIPTANMVYAPANTRSVSWNGDTVVNTTNYLDLASILKDVSKLSFSGVTVESFFSLSILMNLLRSTVFVYGLLVRRAASAIFKKRITTTSMMLYVMLWHVAIDMMDQVDLFQLARLPELMGERWSELPDPQKGSVVVEVLRWIPVALFISTAMQSQSFPGVVVVQWPIPLPESRALDALDAAASAQPPPAVGADPSSALDGPPPSRSSQQGASGASDAGAAAGPWGLPMPLGSRDLAAFGTPGRFGSPAEATPRGGKSYGDDLPEEAETVSMTTGRLRTGCETTAVGEDPATPAGRTPTSMLAAGGDAGGGSPAAGFEKSALRLRFSAASPHSFGADSGAGGGAGDVGASGSATGRTTWQRNMGSPSGPSACTPTSTLTHGSRTVELNTPLRNWVAMERRRVRRLQEVVDLIPEHWAAIARQRATFTSTFATDVPFLILRVFVFFGTNQLFIPYMVIKNIVCIMLAVVQYPFISYAKTEISRIILHHLAVFAITFSADVPHAAASGAASGAATGTASGASAAPAASMAAMVATLPQDWRATPALPKLESPFPEEMQRSPWTPDVEKNWVVQKCAVAVAEQKIARSTLRPHNICLSLLPLLILTTVAVLLCRFGLERLTDGPAGSAPRL